MDPPGFEPGASALQGQRSRGLCLARAALSQSELRAHILSQIDDLVFDCYISNINVLYISHSIHTKIDNHIINTILKV